MILTRAYRAALLLFPPDFRREDRTEAGEVFESLWRNARRRDRLRLAMQVFGPLPWAMARDWTSYLTDTTRHPSAYHPWRLAMPFDVSRTLRQAVRSLWKTPAFTGSVMLLTALGVGAVTTIFTLVDHILLRPLPYPDPERLVVMENGAHSGPLVREMQQLQTVEDLTAARVDLVNLVGEGQPQRMVQAQVSEGFFELFGAAPARGRLLDERDQAAPDRVVVSEGAWRRIWGGDPELIGRAIRIDGRPATVVGILTSAFATPHYVTGSEVDVWRPLDWSAQGMDSHEQWSLSVAGRLRAGASIQDASQEMASLMARMAGVHENYRVEDTQQPRDIPVTTLDEVTVRGVRSGLELLAGAVGLLLLVACANVAHLFLARGIGRSREMAVRRALGAGTPALAGQLAAESVVAGLAGGALGLVLAVIGLRTFLVLNPTALPREVGVVLDLRVLAFAGLLSVATALVFGLLPALKAVGRAPDAELRGSTRASTSGRGVQVMRRGLVVAEVALSLILVASAGLLLRTFIEVQTQDPGFELQNVWTMPLTPRNVGTPDEYRLAMEEVRRSLARTPGVTSASYGLTAPLQLTGGHRCCWRTTLTSADEALEFAPWIHPVSEGFFETFEIRFLQGRVWSPAEATTTPVPVVANEALAVEVAGTAADAVGRRLVRGSGEQTTLFVIVGVSANTRYYGLDAVPEPAAFVPIEFLPFPIPRAHMAVKVAASDAGLPGRLRDGVWAAAPDLPVPTIRSMEEWLDLGTANRRFDSALVSSFGVVALLLAAGGLYGTLLYMAGQRRRELAIRLALGASRRGIEGWMLRGGVTVAGVGVALGIVASWGTARFLESRLWGVERTDPVALFGAAAVLLAVATLASWIPARSAGRTDPLEALQAE